MRHHNKEGGVSKNGVTGVHVQLASADQPTQEVEAIPTPYGGSQTFLNWGHCVNYAHAQQACMAAHTTHTHSTTRVGSSGWR